MKFIAAIFSALILVKAQDYRFSDINSADQLVDPFNMDRLETIHAMIKEWPSETAFDHISSIPDELQPIRFNVEKYLNNFFGEIKPAKKWFIVFLKTFRSQKQFYYSEFVMNTMKVLADEY